MNMLEKKIKVTESKGIYLVPAKLEEGLHLVPCPTGHINLVFWNEDRLKLYLSNFGYYPEIIIRNS
jgi:hypothetical protein